MNILKSKDYQNNKAIYENSETVRFYTDFNELTPTENRLVQKSVFPEFHVLDIGIGGGRTTRYLLNKTARYVGIDYSQAMIDACKVKFPQAELLVADASDLSSFSDKSFDFVFFSFNGIDMLYPFDRRTACLSECRRVLKEDGTLLFSTHNARQILVFPELTTANWLKFFWRIAYALYRTGRLALKNLSRTSFWKGKGYVIDPVHGGLITYQSIPKFVQCELQNAGFELMEVAHTAPSNIKIPLAQPWYYYLARKKA